MEREGGFVEGGKRSRHQREERRGPVSRASAQNRSADAPLPANVERVPVPVRAANSEPFRGLRPKLNWFRNPKAGPRLEPNRGRFDLKREP